MAKIHAEVIPVVKFGTYSLGRVVKDLFAELNLLLSDALPMDVLVRGHTLRGDRTPVEIACNMFQHPPEYWVI